ncbi:AraC family transcriptional regulator [Paenibacillus guangzhouensis]|uniref:AraC family transcriptional regulator n=1 Tax=Paenibacillus guangzhouensis TaxID=1473112 RepID=UPI0012674326|nr:AraC family transcriptional regulator [Paenibacillus guangzhouensis]
MYRECYLPDFSDMQFFCFPHSVGFYSKPFNHNVNRETGVKDYSLHVVMHGKGWIELDDVVYPLKQGDAFLHFPNKKMRYYTSEDDRWKTYWIQFYGHRVRDFLFEKGFVKSSIWSLKQYALLLTAFEELLKEIESNNFMRPSRISSLTFATLNEFICNALPYANLKHNHNYDQITNILPLMQQEAHLPFILETWAERVGLTPNYFCSLFKKTTNMTPVTYVTKCRMQKCKQMLLEDPTLPIKDVALQSGYPSTSYFNKKFMEYEGITPREFRDLHTR